MSNGDVPVTGLYPAVEFQPSETGSVWHTDQEVADSSGSRMYRTYNAQYNGTQWTTLPGGPSDAYATVQNSDGSIHHYWNNRQSTWSTWFGRGNNAVFNAVDYGLVQGAGQSQPTRAANVVALQNAINDAIKTIPPAAANGGGTVVIPAGIYELGGTVSPPMTATITITGVTGGLTIRGESAGTTLVQFGTPPAGGSGPYTAADIFEVSNSNNPVQVGIRFREITFQYANGLSIPTAGAFAINCMSGSADVTADQCGFYKCTQAFSAGPAMGGLQSGLIHCSILQDQSGYPDSTASRP